MDAISRGSTVTNDQLADVKSAKAVQRLIDFQEGRKGIVDAASGLTVDDIASVDLQMEALIKKMLSHSPTLNVNIEYVVTVAALA